SQSQTQGESFAEMMNRVNRRGAAITTDREKLKFLRWMWAVAAYRIVRQRPVVLMPTLIRFVAGMAGVTQREVRKVLSGDAHLSAEALARIEKGLGIYAVIHHPTVMGGAFESVVRIFDRK